MRMAVQTAFVETIHDSPMVCSSGWGSTTKEMADAAIQSATAFAVKTVAARRPVLRELTSGELCKLLTEHARDYVATLPADGVLMEDVDSTSQRQTLSGDVLVGFINHVAAKYGVDYGMPIGALTAKHS